MSKFETWMNSEIRASVTLLVLALLGASIVNLWQPDWTIRGFNMVATLFVYAKIGFANVQMEAHGVTGWFRHRKLLGIPWPITLIYAFLMACIVALGMPYPGLLPQTVTNLHTFSASLLCGWFAGVAHWYYYAHNATYYIDEKNERGRMKRMGWPPEKIEAEIASERKRGLLGPRD